MANAAGPKSEITVHGLSMVTGRDRRTVQVRLEAAKLNPIRETKRSRYYALKPALAAVYDPEIERAPKAEEDTGTVASFADARARHEAAKAELAELELRKARAELIPAEDVEEAQVRLVLLLRSHLLAMPDRGAQETYAATDLREHREIWRRVVHEVLEEISATDVDAALGPFDAPEDGPQGDPGGDAAA